MSGQQGQALVGVLVVMALVLLLAGAVAVGTSALVASERRPDDAVVADLSVQSAVAASVAHVANGATGCTVAASPSSSASSEESDHLVAGTSSASTLSPASVVVSSTAFPEQLPKPTTGAPQVDINVYCLKVPFARDGSLTRQTPRTIQSPVPNSCWSADLPGKLASADFWILFDARWPSGGAAFVANGGQSRCPSATNGKCLVAPGGGGSVTQVAISCRANSLASVTSPALYITSPRALTAGPVFVASQDSTSTEAYCLLVADMGQSGPGRGFEEGVVLARGPSVTLLTEEPLP